MKKFITMLVVSALLFSTAIPSMAVSTSGSGPVPQEVVVIPFDDKSGNGINYVILNPTTAPTTSTITLYDALDGSVAGAEQEIGYKTANDWAKTQFTGLDSSKSYYAVIKMSNGSGEGTYITDAVTPVYKDFDGHSFGRLQGVIHRIQSSARYGHSLTTYHIDSEIYHEGTSSVKITSFGWDGSEETDTGSNRTDLFDSIKFPGIKVGTPAEGDYYELKVAYKGEDIIYSISMNADEKSTSSVPSDGWTVVTKVYQATSATAKDGIKPEIQIKVVTYCKTAWIDSISVRKISDYNAGSYSSLGDNIVLGGGFDVAVKNLRMDSANRQLSWELPESALFYALNIYKDGTLIDTINYSGYHGVTETSYTISAGNWDADSTYTVKAIPTTGGIRNNTTPTTATQEGPAVYVKNPSFVLSEDGEGAKATVYSADSTYSALLMCCEYLNNNFDELIQFVSVPVSIQQLNTEQEFSLTPTRTRPGSKFKAFLWEFENLTALADDLDMTNVP